jgi:hypothetical protein
MGAIPAVAFVSVAYLPASLPVPAGISSLSRLCSNICYCFYEFGSGMWELTQKNGKKTHYG